MTDARPDGCPASLGKLAPAKPAEQEQRPGWVGMAAVAWVIDDAPVPADLAFTLVVIARRCGEDGTGSYQSVPTIAKKAGKSVDQVHRDIAKLRELGLLLLGDQSKTSHLPAGQRPVVYDLPLHMSGPKPLKESKNKSGKKKEVTTSSEGTPGMDATPGMHAGGGMEAGSTPGMDAESTPCMDATQRDPLNNPVEQPSLSLAAAEGPPAEDRERDEPDSHPNPKNTPDPYSDRRPYLAAQGITDHEVQDQAIRQIELMNNVKSPGWWITAAKNGTLPARIAAAVERLVRQAEWASLPRVSPTTPSRPDWCGKCDHVTRTIDAPGGAAHAQIRCPACHPKSIERSAA